MHDVLSKRNASREENVGDANGNSNDRKYIYCTNHAKQA